MVREGLKMQSSFIDNDGKQREVKLIPLNRNLHPKLIVWAKLFLPSWNHVLKMLTIIKNGTISRAQRYKIK